MPSEQSTDRAEPLVPRTTARQCLVCNEMFDAQCLAGAQLLEHFDDLCICATCLQREREGSHGKR